MVNTSQSVLKVFEKKSWKKLKLKHFEMAVFPLDLFWQRDQMETKLNVYNFIQNAFLYHFNSQNVVAISWYMNFKWKSSLQRICSTEIFLFQLLWSSKAEQLKNPKNATGFVMKNNFYPQFNSFLLWNQEQAWSKSNKFKHVVKNWSL